MDSIEREENIETKKKSFFKSTNGILVVILLAAWLVGMSIVVAGWLISRQIAINHLSSVSSNQQATQPAKPAKVDIQIADNAAILGSKDAKVSVIIFADFQCPFCGRWQKETYPLLKSEYIDKGLVKLDYMDYAFLGDESVRAAEAAKCAEDQGKFWEYHDLLFANQNGENEGAFTDAKLMQFAKNLKLQSSVFNACLTTEKHKSDVDADTQTGTTYGVDSTPTVFINGNRYEGIFKFSDYENVINAELKK